jgi:EAL domain-containing protein (putative c-di-GMP-specific phosphodiesterase class I)
MLRRQLARYPQLPTGQLQIEVLESTALEDVVAVSGIINACRELGVGFALDDFGTGYSSLSYLSRLPVDTLKIDQSFVRDMLGDKGDMAIVQGIIALAHTFNLRIVAEGIETPEHYSTLLELGCEIGQGYDIARPMPAHELEHWHAERPLPTGKRKPAKTV